MPRNATTEEIAQMVEARPGVQAPALARSLELHPSTVTYHLRKLERQARAISQRSGRQLCYYPVGRGWCPSARRIHAALTETGTQALRVALETGAVSRRELIEQGASRSAARYAVETLLEAGALERLAWGVYTLTEGTAPCARAAVRAGGCRGCNPGLSEQARPEELTAKLAGQRR